MRNLKKVIALVAVFAMMVTSVAFAQTYSDVKEDDNYYEAIEMLSKLNILTGDDKDGDGVMDFRPNDTITRAEVAAVICRIQDLNNLSQTTTPFTDVPSSHWASGYVAQAAGQGIINGYGDGNFGPEDDVTYEQAVKMFVETLGYTPFVNANGGYPTGHLTAAQRYGVLDGVVGASVGAKATRGQIAQIAFNAIDTPIMDRSSYGKDEEFTIFDGTNNKDFETLLTRDLKVKKFSGWVKSTQISEDDIDTDEKAKVTVKWDGSYDSSDDLTSLSTDNKNYEVDEITSLYAADSNVEDYLGYFVDGYAKETDKTGEYDVIAVAPGSKNKVVTFTLDQFDSLESTSGNYSNVNYYKNDNDKKTTAIKVSNNADIFYNGSENSDFDALDDVFGSGKLVEKDSKWSGNVKFIDNGETTGSNYDVVFVNIAASAVVDEVSTSGKISFKNSPRANGISGTINVTVDEDDNTQLIKFTKDGKDFDYKELKEWDVLSIYYNGGNYYDIRVLGSNKIDAAISNKSKSDTSGDEYKYTIDGKTYDVAENAYGTKTGGWAPGTAGVFYIDDNGKIVAYDKNGSTTASTTSGNYAYIMDTQETTDFDNGGLQVQILDKSGKVYTPNLATKVKFENATGKALGLPSGETYSDQKSYEVKKLDLDELAATLKNQFVTYDVNSSGDIKTITFWQSSDEDDNSLYKDASADSYSYDEENKEIKVGNKKFDVDDDTIVFFIKTDSSTTFYSKKGSSEALDFSKDAPTASKSASKVGKATTLGDTGNTAEDKVAAVFDADNDVAGVIVLFDTTGGISASSNIAVIDSIGEGDNNGSTVTTAKFYKGGVLMTAYADSDLDSGKDSALKAAKRGDLFKFSLSADETVINDLEVVATVAKRTEYVGDTTTYAAGNDGALDVGVDTAYADKVTFGPVYDYASSGKKIKIATKGASAWDFTLNTDTIKASEANVYVLDPNKNSNKLTVGDAGDVDFDKDLYKKDSAKAVYKRGTTTVLVPAAEQALGMMDYAVAVENNDGDVIDVVIYKAYDFGKYEVK